MGQEKRLLVAVLDRATSTSNKGLAECLEMRMPSTTSQIAQLILSEKGRKPEIEGIVSRIQEGEGSGEKENLSGGLGRG